MREGVGTRKFRWLVSAYTRPYCGGGFKRAEGHLLLKTAMSVNSRLL
jgi:hypothetical protein